MPKTSEKKPSIQQEFFFSGGMEYEPMTVEAESQAEAIKIWEKNRNKINS